MNKLKQLILLMVLVTIWVGSTELALAASPSPPPPAKRRRLNLQLTVRPSRVDVLAKELDIGDFEPIGRGTFGTAVKARPEGLPACIVKMFTKCRSNVQDYYIEIIRQRQAAAVGAAPQVLHGLFLIKPSLPAQTKGFAMQWIDRTLSLDAFLRSEYFEGPEAIQMVLIQQIVEGALNTFSKLRRIGLHHNDISDGNLLVVHRKEGVDVQVEKVLFIDFGTQDDLKGRPELNVAEAFDLDGATSKNECELFSFALLILKIVGAYDPSQHMLTKIPKARVFALIRTSRLADPVKALLTDALEAIGEEAAEPNIIDQFAMNHPDFYNPVGDGYCFWHALAHGLNQLGISSDPFSSASLMQLAVEHMIANPGLFAPFFAGATPEEQVEAIQLYVEGLQQGQWASDPIIQAIVNALGIELHIPFYLVGQDEPTHTFIVTPSVVAHPSVVITLPLFNNLHFFALNRSPRAAHRAPEALEARSMNASHDLKPGAGMEPQVDVLAKGFIEAADL